MYIFRILHIRFMSYILFTANGWTDCNVKKTLRINSTLSASCSDISIFLLSFLRQLCFFIIMSRQISEQSYFARLPSSIQTKFWHMFFPFIWTELLHFGFEKEPKRKHNDFQMSQTQPEMQPDVSCGGQYDNQTGQNSCTVSLKCLIQMEFMVWTLILYLFGHFMYAAFTFVSGAQSRLQMSDSKKSPLVFVQ